MYKQKFTKFLFLFTKVLTIIVSRQQNIAFSRQVTIIQNKTIILFWHSTFSH